jgi:hypothetical protein
MAARSGSCEAGDVERRARRSTDTTAREDRIALLSTELDVQRADAQDRATSVQNKASFLVVAAGLFSASTGTIDMVEPNVWADSAVAHFLPGLPILFGLATVVFCALALWPTAQQVVIPQKLTDEWLDTPQSADALREFLLRMKVEAWDELQRITDRRVVYLKWGFGFLVLAVAATLLVVVLRALA